MPLDRHGKEPIGRRGDAPSGREDAEAKQPAAAMPGMGGTPGSSPAGRRITQRAYEIAGTDPAIIRENELLRRERAAMQDRIAALERERDVASTAVARAIAAARRAKDAEADARTELAAALRRAPAGDCGRILTETAAKHGLEVVDLVAARRSKHLVPARHEAMYRCVRETTLSLTVIGRIFHRNHTSVGYGAMMHADRNNLPSSWA